jgi:hypothetical protein
MAKGNSKGRSQWPLIILVVCLILLVLYSRYKKSFRFGDTSGHSMIDPRDSSLWAHIYHDERLKVLKSRITATGVIERVRKEKDGDDHILLHLDAGQENLLNEKNIREQHGDLVVEPICVNKVKQEDAIVPCSGYLNNVVLPDVGDTVSVTGTYVLDMEHGWNEIHPVTEIVVRRGKPL